jgi:hypothetical protein
MQSRLSDFNAITTQGITGTLYWDGVAFSPTVSYFLTPLTERILKDAAIKADGVYRVQLEKV